MKIRVKRRPRPVDASKLPKLEIKNLGQIQQATVEFGDLTVFVGPQATGKSIVLQMLKLVLDTGLVQEELRRYGIDWAGKVPDLFDAYFGEGMRSIWKSNETVIRWNDTEIELKKLARWRKAKEEKLFFIPAQRVLALRDGWPRPFTDYSTGDPFAVREFSEQLRGLVEKDFSGESLFPQTKRLKQEFRRLLERDVFSKYSLKVDKLRSQKRLVLGGDEETTNLPYMVWSAGQREFVPLLLGFYWLMPPTKVSRRGKIEWVVIEELEMGLHPKAISVVLLMVFELVARGYRVCLSTHASQVLDAMWTLKHLCENGAKPETLLDVFAARKTPAMVKMAETVMTKMFKVHYFDRESGTTRDISALDPTAEEEGQLGWGGLSEFSGRANDAVARAVANPQSVKK